VSLPHYGPHALRHACAARLLADGLSLKEIGDQLGHTDLTPRAFMPRWISSAFAKWRILSWEECCELQRLIEQYISFQHSLGSVFTTDAITLALSGVPVARGPALPVCVPACGRLPGQARPVTTTWFGKLSRLRQFFKYAVSRGYLSALPLPTVLPQRPPTFVPYIYSQDEIRRLLRTIDSDRRSACLEPATIRTLVLLFYGAGLRLREATNLTRADVDLSRSLLTIRNTKFGKKRVLYPLDRN